MVKKYVVKRSHEVYDEFIPWPGEMLPKFYETVFPGIRKKDGPGLKLILFSSANGGAVK